MNLFCAVVKDFFTEPPKINTCCMIWWSFWCFTLQNRNGKTASGEYQATGTAWDSRNQQRTNAHAGMINKEFRDWSNFIECRKVVCFATTMFHDWLKNSRHFSTNRDSLALVFPRFASATCNYFELWLVHWNCRCPMWLAKVITLVFGFTTLNWKLLYV